MFPAPAGINRGYVYARFRKGRVPRASGDKPIQKFNMRLEILCSPRQRG